MHEARYYEKNCFLTLTYDDGNLPDDGSLYVSDWQYFAKRLRKRIGPFRFFHCGEYGEVNFRPHYHALIFGEDFSADRTKLNSVKTKNPLYVSPLVDECWGMGIHSIGDLSYESAEYVSRYCLKKVQGKDANRYYSRIVDGDLIKIKPEYVTMSRGGRTGQGGIGSRFIKEFKGDVYPRDEVIHDGRRFKPPRFYDNKLSEEEREELKYKRRRNMKRNVTSESLDAAEEILRSKSNLVKRKV